MGMASTLGMAVCAGRRDRVRMDTDFGKNNEKEDFGNGKAPTYLSSR